MLFNQMQEGSAAPSIGLKKDLFVAMSSTQKKETQKQEEEEVNSMTGQGHKLPNSVQVFGNGSKVVVG